MKSFVLAAITILVGTFIVNLSAEPQQTSRTAPDLPSRTEISQLDKQFADLADSIASDIGQIKKQVADLPDELAAFNSQFNVLTARQDSFDERLSKLESKCNSCDCSTPAQDVSAKVQSQSEMLTRLLGRIEKLEGKSPVVVSSSSTSQAKSSHWTYPGGDIAAHLRDAHGVVVSGSVEDQLNAHDAIHEGRASTRTVSRSTFQTSSCPGGVCPTSRSVSSGSYSVTRLGGFRLFSR